LAGFLAIVPLLVLAAIAGTFSNLTGTPLITTADGADEGYVGAEMCGICHKREYDAWNQSYHNNAGLLNITDGTKWYWMSPPWLHNGSTRIYNDAQFARCASCHATGYDEETGTWPGSDSLDPEEAGAFLGVQCETCHGPGLTMEVDYAGGVCSSCHGEGSHIQSLDYSIGPHNSTLSEASSDSCTSCHSTQGYLASQGVIDMEVTLETEGLTSISCVVCHSPHDAANSTQLRLESITELCGQCHTGTTHYPQYDFYIEGPHEKAGVECTQCHGEGTHLAHGSISETFNHTFGIYDTYYPYNQTDPVTCSKCHDQTWATTQLGVIQTTAENIIENVTEAIHEADAAISSASQVSGVDQAKIDEAMELFETAEALVESVEADKSRGLHNPEGSFELLSEALVLASEASSLVNNAVQEVTSSQLSSIQEDLSSVQGNLNITETYMYIGAIGGIIGGLFLGLLVGRRWTTA
jgi:predicted CXXCH cytochrome family protein